LCFGAIIPRFARITFRQPLREVVRSDARFAAKGEDGERCLCMAAEACAA
jgi:hypothetical protein